MEEQEDIEFAEILSKVEAGENNLYPPDTNPQADHESVSQEIFQPVSEKMDWRTKLTLGILLCILFAGIGITIYLLNLPNDLMLPDRFKLPRWTHLNKVPFPWQNNILSNKVKESIEKQL